VSDSKTIMVNVNKSYSPGMKPGQVMEIAQGDWRISQARAAEIDSLVAVAKGAVVGEFKVKGVEKVEETGRIRFSLGTLRNKVWTDKDVSGYYVRGAANSVRYV
jgi:hypothetical protein